MIQRKGVKALQYAALLLVTFIFVLPLLWLLSTALKTSNEVFTYPPKWIPDAPRWSNFADAFTTVPYGQYMLNTGTVVFFAVLGNVISAPMIGYAFAKLDWKGRDKLFILVLATMMLPFQITMIPLYSMYAKLGWVNTYLPLVLPDFFGKAYFIFLMRQFFKGLPTEIMESGRIDGASEFRIYAQLMLPLARPGLISVALFAFTWSWTDFMGPLIYLTDQSRWTISLGLSQFTTSHGFDWPLLMAASAIFILPMMVFFFFLQKYFIQGISTSGLK